MKIIACNSSKSLAEKISKHIDVPLADASVRTFNDREIFVEINENIRGEDVFIIQSTSHPANDHLMELLITIDAARRGSAKRVAATATQSEVGDTARALKKRGGMIGGTKTGRRLAIVGQRVASRLGLTPKADAAAKKKALNRRINKKGELRKDIDRGVGLSKLGF